MHKLSPQVKYMQYNQKQNFPFVVSRLYNRMGHVGLSPELRVKRVLCVARLEYLRVTLRAEQDNLLVKRRKTLHRGRSVRTCKYRKLNSEEIFKVY